MNVVTLVEETRAGIVENVHTGMICGVNEKLETLYHAGNSAHYTYYRSAAKPIQALPVFLSNCITKYGLTREEATLFTASHRGEHYHIAALESMLKKLPVHENELFCPASYPLMRCQRKKCFEKTWRREGCIITVRENIWGL